MKEIVLLKDLVIPAGTIFKNIEDSCVEYIGDNYQHRYNYQYIFGLTKDSFGSIVYLIEDIKEMDRWFAEVKR